VIDLQFLLVGCLEKAFLSVFGLLAAFQKKTNFFSVSFLG